MASAEKLASLLIQVSEVFFLLLVLDKADRASLGLAGFKPPSSSLPPRVPAGFWQGPL